MLQRLKRFFARKRRHEFEPQPSSAKTRALRHTVQDVTGSWARRKKAAQLKGQRPELRKQVHSIMELKKGFHY